MGYNDDSVVKVDQEFFEPFNSRQIKVVGRLIQKKNVRITKQCLRQKNFDLLAAGQVCHLSIMEFGFDSEAIQKSGSIGLCLPSVHLGEFTFKGEEFEEPAAADKPAEDGAATDGETPADATPATEPAESAPADSGDAPQE